MPYQIPIKFKKATDRSIEQPAAFVRKHPSCCPHLLLRRCGQYQNHPHHLNNNANNDNICCVVELHDVFHVFLPRFVFDVFNFTTV